MSVYVLPWSVIFLRLVPGLVIAVLSLAAIALVARAIQGVFMTSPRLNRVASSLLTTIALGLAIFFVFVVTILVMPARAEAKPVKASPQKTQRIVRDVTPLFAAADTQQFSARAKRYVKKRYAKRHYRAARPAAYIGLDIRAMTPQERSEYYTSGGRYAATNNAPSRKSAGRSYADAGGNHLVVGGRQPGDPWRYCGAEAVRYVFKVAASARRDLWLAANWIRKFERTAAAPDMVAARPGHVMTLISHVGGLDWWVHDGNSGGGLTRKHVRSIAGYTIVDPRSPRTATARVTGDYSARGRHASATR